MKVLSRAFWQRPAMHRRRLYAQWFAERYLWEWCLFDWKLSGWECHPRFGCSIRVREHWALDIVHLGPFRIAWM